MRIAISIAVLVGSTAVAVANPIASPGPPKPKDPKDDVGMNVAKVGPCPVRSKHASEGCVPVADSPTRLTVGMRPLYRLVAILTQAMTACVVHSLMP
jgi:hypothetical protein